jgi:hypothetical protein
VRRLNRRPIKPATINKAPAINIQCGYSISESTSFPLRFLAGPVFREDALNLSHRDGSAIAERLHRPAREWSLGSTISGLWVSAEMVSKPDTSSSSPARRKYS